MKHCPPVIASMIFCISSAYAGESHKIGDISVTLNEPGMLIGQSYKKGKSGEKINHSISFEKLAILRTGGSLVINDKIYHNIPGNSNVTIELPLKASLNGTVLKGEVLLSKFSENDWGMDQNEVDGITFKISCFRAGNFYSTYDEAIPRKKGEKISMAYGLISITFEKGDVYLWGQLIGKPTKLVSINQQSRTILIDGKEAKWPE
jgi:hypothetical protein